MNIISDIRQLSNFMTEVEGYSKRNSIENDLLRAIGCIKASKLNLEKCDEISDKYSHYLPSLEFVLSQLENLLLSMNRSTCLLYANYDHFMSAIRPLALALSKS